MNLLNLKKFLLNLKKSKLIINNSKTDGTKISLADLIVLGGNVGVEQATKQAGYSIDIPFVPGRTDATQAQTDIESFNYLKTKSDGFINYTDGSVAADKLAQALVEKASLLNLNIPEMTVLVGGMRALNVNYDNSQEGILTTTPGQLNNSFFVNLLDMSTEWKKSDKKDGEYIGIDRKTGKQK